MGLPELVSQNHFTVKREEIIIHMIMSYVLGETNSSIQHNGSGVPVEPYNNTMKVEPESIHAFLQAACAGLGFDIGEVWWYSDPKGPSSKSGDLNSSNSSFIDIQNSVGG